MPSLQALPLYTLASALCPRCNPEPPTAHCHCCRDTSRDDRAGIAALTSLCATSRALNAAATPHLYHRPTCVKWWLLARTLIDRPDLGRLVRELDASCWGWLDDGKDMPAEITSYLEARTSRHRERARVGEPVVPTNENQNWVDPDWEKQLEKRRLEIVMSLCPAIEHLDALLPYFTRPFARFTPGALPGLRSARIRHSDTESGFDLARLSPLPLVAPTLQHLVCVQVDACTIDPLETIFSQVTELRVLESALGADSLRNLLRACPKLEVFEYTMDPGGVGYEQFTDDEAEEIIPLCAPGLRELILDKEELPMD